VLSRKGMVCSANPAFWKNITKQQQDANNQNTKVTRAITDPALLKRFGIAKKLQFIHKLVDRAVRGKRYPRLKQKQHAAQRPQQQQPRTLAAKRIRPQWLPCKAIGKRHSLCAGRLEQSLLRQAFLNSNAHSWHVHSWHVHSWHVHS